MELFGIGIWEVLLIVLIALIFLGPQDTIRAGRGLGRAVRRFFSSEEWRTMLQASREIRAIPDKLLEETGLDHPEDILPSAEEIRREAGLDDLAQNMAEWNADVSAMKETGQAPSEPQSGAVTPAMQVTPAVQETPQTGPTMPPTPETSPASIYPVAQYQDASYKKLLQDIARLQADQTGWGNSEVLIPVPQAATTETVSPPTDQTESKTPEQAAASDTPPEQGNT